MNVIPDISLSKTHSKISIDNFTQFYIKQFKIKSSKTLCFEIVYTQLPAQTCHKDIDKFTKPTHIQWM